MKVVVKGHGSVKLSKRDFVAQGGEGTVYAQGDTAYKIYSDPARMIPLGKLHALTAIADGNVVKPERVVFDAKGQAAIGYTMRFVSDALALCQLFPRAFRERNGITPTVTLELVRKLQKRVESVHRAGVLVVDLNEMNALADASLSELYLIDVDSYQTPQYPATAILPSVRDWQVALGDFTELSDWYSFAIVSFQMFVGIHPFKGKHPRIKGLEARMRANVSVLDPDVTVPRSCYPLDVIPDAYRDWYRALFQHGKRLPPPVGVHTVIPVVQRVQPVRAGTALDISLEDELGAEILGMWESLDTVVARTLDGLYLDGQRVADAPRGSIAVGFSNRHNRPIVATLDRGLTLFDASRRTPVPIVTAGNEIMSCGGRVYVRHRDKVLELTLSDVGDGVVASPRVAAQVLEHATRLHDGVAIQDVLGAAYALVFPQAGTCHTIRIPELDGYDTLHARHDERVLMIIGRKHGQCDRLIIRFASDFSSYDLRTVADVGTVGLNFVTLDSGVCVCLDENDNLEVFSSRHGSAAVKIIGDDALGGDMILTKRAGRIMFLRRNRAYRMSLRSPS